MRRNARACWAPLRRSETDLVGSLVAPRGALRPNLGRHRHFKALSAGKLCVRHTRACHSTPVPPYDDELAGPAGFVL
jgi:hypothetical protein